MAATSSRASARRDTRGQIVEAALKLFVRQGLADTTFDQIAEAAGVGRRTIFHHFPTKEAILFDHFVLRRDVAIERLRERPADEPVLVSLHVVLRELCDHGFDRDLLKKIRSVIAAEPRLESPPVSLGLNDFELKVIDVVEGRLGPGSGLQARAVTYMALGWVAAAANAHLAKGETSLVECFDAAVDACLQMTPADLRRVKRRRAKG
jgi:AcrR family transcriptional regulator